jgi:transposase, IS30 family
MQENKRQRSYQQLQAEDRVTIASLQRQGYSVRAMARTLTRSPSTISREIARNSRGELFYGSRAAHSACGVRRRASRASPKQALDSPLWRWVLTALHWQWSPQQISATLKRMYPHNPELHLSHETIYTALYAHPGGSLRRELIACLRQGRSTRRPRSAGTDRRGRLLDMVSIHLRPPAVADRVLPGHWEGDFIKGAHNASSVGVLVERVTRLVVLAKMADACAASALSGFSRQLNAIAKPLRQTLTYDQGKEMADHAKLSKKTGVRVYFCDPHSPWQRGTCENTNGLLRQYLPKGTDLSVHSQADLDAIADRLNNRPRQSLQWHSPLEVFAKTLADLNLPISHHPDPLPAIIH